MGAVGSSLCAAAEAHPAGPARRTEAPPSGQEESGSSGAYPARVDRPLPGAAGHAGKGRTKKGNKSVCKVDIDDAAAATAVADAAASAAGITTVAYRRASWRW